MGFSKDSRYPSGIPRRNHPWKSTSGKVLGSQIAELSLSTVIDRRKGENEGDAPPVCFLWK